MTRPERVSGTYATEFGGLFEAYANLKLRNPYKLSVYLLDPSKPRLTREAESFGLNRQEKMTGQAPLDAVVSHWSTLIENLQVSPLAFYEAVESALVRREIPATKNERVDFREAGLLSANREYLHVRREKLVFDICGAPFGTGFFVSWWLAEERSALHPAARAVILLLMLFFTLWLLSQLGLVIGLVMLVIILMGSVIGLDQMVTLNNVDEGIVRSLPIIGTLYVWMFKPASYYRIDSMEMFQKAVHNAVLEVIDGMTAEKGLRALSDSDRKPIMREFYSKKSA